MSEKLDMTSRDFPGFFLIAALVQAGEDVQKQITEKDVEVQLLVNGIEFPFTKTIEDIYSRMLVQIDSQALEMAEKMVTEAGLDAVAEVLREVEWKVKDALAQVN